MTGWSGGLPASPRRRGARSPLSGGTISAPWRPLRRRPVGRRISEEASLEIAGLGTYVAVGDLEAADEAMRFAVTAGSSRPSARPGVWPFWRADGNREVSE